MSFPSHSCTCGMGGLLLSSLFYIFDICAILWYNTYCRELDSLVFIEGVSCMKKKTGSLLRTLSVFTLGMYVSTGISTGVWIPNGWLLTVILALFALWFGYLLGWADYAPPKVPKAKAPEGKSHDGGSH